jgi:hypothetical protein
MQFGPGEGLPSSLELIPETPSLHPDDYAQVPRAFLRDNAKAIDSNSIGRLHEIRARWKAAQADIDGVGDVPGRLQQKRVALAKKLSVGETITAEQIVSRPALEADIEEVKQLGIETQRQLGAQVFEIAQKVFRIS